MSHPKGLKITAMKMRCDGVSMPEIARCLGVSKSTVSLWVGDIPLSEDMRKRFEDGRKQGMKNGLATLRARRERETDDLKAVTASMAAPFHGIDDQDYWKLVAALLFWCEGSKRDLSGLVFVNSDPQMMKTFVRALRGGFDLDESKFRPLLHLHEYHDERKQITFWSKATGIPPARFAKTYRKPHTGKRIRDGYQGCMSLRYGDAHLAKTLSALYHAFAERMGA